jgi:hypothetical protein
MYNKTEFLFFHLQFFSANQKKVPVCKSSEQKKKKKTATELRLERLQEFRKQKQEKKKEGEKTKKKPWRAGLRQSAGCYTSKKKDFTFNKKEVTDTQRETTNGNTKASVWKVTSINRAKVCILYNTLFTVQYGFRWQRNRPFLIQPSRR